MDKTGKMFRGFIIGSLLAILSLAPVAMAAEQTGTITSRNAENRTVVIDGRIYFVPEEVMDFSMLYPGMRVSYQTANEAGERRPRITALLSLEY